MIKKLECNANFDNIIATINQIIDMLNKYEEDGVWTAREFREKIKEELYNSYIKK